jgi:hypothetical protein
MKTIEKTGKILGFAFLLQFITSHHLVTRWFIVEYNLAITYNHVF